MTYDYLAAFPLPVDAIPSQLRKLLMPIGLNPNEEVDVARFYDQPDKQVNDEHLYLQMAVVQGGGHEPIAVFRETSLGVVAYSTRL